MANNHGYINTTHCSCWDIDAYNCAGIATTDIDNGVLVTLGTINRDTTTLKVKGYEFNVTPAGATSTSVWVVDSPEVGTTLEMQLLADPRNFYNPAGVPMSIKYLTPKVDCIEVTAECFTDKTLPTSAKTFVEIGAGGKLTAAASAPASGAYFSLVGLKTITFGMEEVPTAVLRIERN